MSSTTSSGKCSAPTRSSTVVFGCAPESTIGARDRLAVGERDAGDAAVARRRSTPPPRPVRTTAPSARALPASASRDRAHAAAHVPPRAADAVELAELVVEQVVGGAGRARAGPHADHAGRRVRALQRVVLEPVVEQVADRHRHHAVELVQPAAREPGGAAGLAQQLEHVARVLGADRGRRAAASSAAARRRRAPSSPRTPASRRRRAGRRARARRAPSPRRCGRGSACRRRRTSRTAGRAGSGRSRSA